MSHKSWMRFVFALVVAVASMATSARAEESARQSGVIEGVLTAKGENWIMVRADNERESRKYIPRWIGGMPKDGGSPDKAIVTAIKSLVVNSRVKITWLFSEHLRVTGIQVLKLPEGGGEDKPKSGVFTGIVTAKGENWISLREDGQKESQKFVPRWIGGMPKDGGGYNKDILRLIAQTQVGARVRIEWVFQEHLRVVALRPVE